eukprot:760091-Hanusia_phi.AAC.4
MFQAVAEGTVEGQYSMTPHKYLRVTPPSKEELMDIGYTEEQAEKHQGGPVNTFDLRGEKGAWNWRGWYRSFWRHQGQASAHNYTMRNPMGPSWREQRNLTKTSKVWERLVHIWRHPKLE